MCKESELQLLQTDVPLSSDAEENQGSELWYPSLSIKLSLSPEHDTDRLIPIR